MINRQDVRNTIERLQDSAVQHNQAMRKIEREIKRLELALGEHKKAYEDIQSEISDWEKKLK